METAFIVSYVVFYNLPAKYICQEHLYKTADMMLLNI